jgi:ribosomal-protein-alanine N-acetyltransferase
VSDLAERLATLHATCFQTPRPWTAVEFDDLLKTPGVFLCHRPDGFALGRVLTDECELLTIAVSPRARRAGLGRALLADFEASAMRAGAAAAFLEVSARNLAARALYDSAGYRLAGTRKAYYRAPNGERTDALIYSRRLG